MISILRAFALLAAGFAAAGQTPTRDPIADLQSQVQELRATVGELRAELASVRSEVAAARGMTGEPRAEVAAGRAGQARAADHSVAGAGEARTRVADAGAGQAQAADAVAELASLRGEVATARGVAESGELRTNVAGAGAVAGRAGQAQAADAVAALAEEQQVTAAKVNEQDQTKVSSGSRYRVRLSGMALFNLFSTSGAADNIDVPWMARPREPGESGGSFGATVRQSLLTLDVFGPEWRGGRVSGDVTFDFLGGFPSMTEGLTAGLARLRTATLRMDWKNTAIVAGQEAPFFSPRSPTSLASTGYPAFSYSGNLWTWTPEVYVEHRIAGLSLQAGILDALTGELPASEYSRMPTAGESSRMPAYAARAGWQAGSSGFGAGGYYSRQNWGSGRTVDAWAATGDWDVALGRGLSFSGELYRGRAIAGLGAGATGSVTGLGLPVDSAGGWSQLKFKPQQRIEFNAAYGSEHAFRRGLSDRNSSAFVNTIFQARSNLLFTVEYRRIWTRFSGPQNEAGHINLGVGILF